MKTIRNYKLIAIGIAVICISCNNVKRQDLTIVDNLRLGQTVDNFYKECDSLGIKEYILLSENPLYKNMNLADYAIRANYTERFNVGNFCGSNKHLGIFYLNTLQGTDNIWKVTILLGNIEKPYDPDHIINPEQKNDIYHFEQNVNVNMLENIKNLIISKYGLPNDTLYGENISFEVIKGNMIKKGRQVNEDVGILYKWETNALLISFFTGISNPLCFYRINQGEYWSTMYGVELIENQIKCLAYSYISYELKPEVIKKLNLNKVKI